MVWVTSIFLLATITMILTASYAFLTGSSLKTAYGAALIVLVTAPFYGAHAQAPNHWHAG